MHHLFCTLSTKGSPHPLFLKKKEKTEKDDKAKENKLQGM